MDARQALRTALGCDYRLNETDEDDAEVMADFYAAEKVLIEEFGPEASENLSTWYTHWHATSEEIKAEGENPDKYEELVLVMTGVIRV